jgi:hypothetical protein
VEPNDLAVGDCLYVRVPTSPSDAQVIGSPDGVRSVLLSGGAERASCTASHGHEVSRVLDLTTLRYTLAESEVACRDAFAAYVGHPIDGSRYTTFPVLPDDAAQAAGASIGLCLVARADGQWMDHAARGSGE